MDYNFNHALQCSFKDCFIPCLITFLVVFVGVGLVNLWIYFRLVALAKKKYGEGFVSGPIQEHKTKEKTLTVAPYGQLDQVFQDPYPGITDLDKVKEEELWRLMKSDKNGNTANYFNLLSTQFLKKKGYKVKQIEKIRVSGNKLSKCQNY